jgi:hypothetical protein
MPRTMFTEVVSRRASSGRNWYTIPLSLLVHAAIFAILIVTPILATGEIPMPARLMPSYILAEVVPSPPPSAVAQRHPSHEVKSVDTQIAPIETPPTIGVETGIVPDQESIRTNGVENLVEGFGGNGVVFE